jgi:hypothetical protein
MERFPPPRLRRARHRGIYLLGIAVVICLGLGSRAEAVGLPPFAAKYAGDALWALTVFLGWGLLLPPWRTAAVAGLAVVVYCAVEFSQLYHAPWIDTARQTTLGGLVLGDTFAWGDIAAYLVGIAVGAALEWAGQRIPGR